ncbi:hypothetical protein TRAPUB_9717 [Trametes pubescens]|uniref:Uncharacterized protein n=1 Tax=Trametes pubescens TaxID=154538 RepID=A0A1M2W1I6_TRAPU|nr:hypothetical protein TRAPUB_9717 [Trametes pubescens]
MNAITVYAKERGRAPSDMPRRTRIRDVVSLDIVIPPVVPLQIGQRVCVQVLRRRRSRNGSLAAGYECEPIGVEGTIVGVRTMELAVTELIVRNEDYRSATEHAYLSIQHIHGVTIRLSLWHTVLRTLLLPILPHTRHIPLERNADVTP